MSLYPSKLAVILPQFVIADDPIGEGRLGRFVFLNAYSLFKVERRGTRFCFEEHRRIDETATHSIDLLASLCNEIDEDCSIVGLRLDRLIGSLIRTPRGETREEEAKEPLKKLGLALANEIVDAAWCADRPSDRTLEGMAERYDLPCEWGKPGREGNPAMLERQLSARAQGVWLAVAVELLPAADLRRALADYDAWRTAHAIT